VVLSIIIMTAVLMLVQALPFGLMVAGLREEEEATGTRIQVVEEEGCRNAGDRGHTTSDSDVGTCLAIALMR